MQHLQSPGMTNLRPWVQEVEQQKKLVSQGWRPAVGSSVYVPRLGATVKVFLTQVYYRTRINVCRFLMFVGTPHN